MITPIGPDISQIDIDQTLDVIKYYIESVSHNYLWESEEEKEWRLKVQNTTALGKLLYK